MRFPSSAHFSLFSWHSQDGKTFDTSLSLDTSHTHLILFAANKSIFFPFSQHLLNTSYASNPGDQGLCGRVCKVVHRCVSSQAGVWSHVYVWVFVFESEIMPSTPGVFLESSLHQLLCTPNPTLAGLVPCTHHLSPFILPGLSLLPGEPYITAWHTPLCLQGPSFSNPPSQIHHSLLTLSSHLYTFLP